MSENMQQDQQIHDVLATYVDRALSVVRVNVPGAKLRILSDLALSKKLIKIKSHFPSFKIE